MRKCTAVVWNKEKKSLETIKGEFHRWAAEYDEFESGPGNSTVALIEIESGQIVTAPPTSVVFLKDDEVIE